MNENMIYNLLDLAISLAQSHLDGSDLEQTLFELAQKSKEAFEEQTGMPLDQRMIGPEFAL
jgi:hypothetical protein